MSADRERSETGHMRWRVFVSGHDELGSIDVDVPRGIDLALAVRIMLGANRAMEGIARAWGIAGAVTALEAQTYDADGNEVRL